MSNSSAEPRTPTELIYSCQGLVRTIAWKIHQKLPRTVELDDLIAYGQVGLAEAARDFDPGRGMQFTTYAYYRVRGAVLDGLSTMSWFNQADYNRGRYERAANEVLRSGNDDGHVAEELDWFARTTQSLSAAYILTHFMGEHADTHLVDHSSPTATVDASDLRSTVERLLTGLPEQERSLIQGVYFEGLSIKDAGERIGISKAWASRLHARVLETLSLRLAGDYG